MSTSAESESQAAVVKQEPGEPHPASDNGGQGKPNAAKSKRQRRREKKKEKKKQAQEPIQIIKDEPGVQKPEDIKIEYVSAAVDLPDDMEAFKDIFAKFKSPEELCNPVKTDSETKEGEAAEQDESGETKEEEEEEEEEELSNKKKKKQNRLTVADLKQFVNRADVVEVHDCNSADPRLLVHLKSYRNTVPVPKHWCQKRKYLQNKRGMEKPPFQLPPFIVNTGVCEIRDAMIKQDESKKMKQKQRERTAPKIGKMDIDYHVLHAAFFKEGASWRPNMTGHGDIYYEGKELELRLRVKKPGHLSEELMKALGMQPGSPPPWLLNMQRYGPPPSYKNLKIPGLNCPIPAGARFGYGEGEWGKPPVDEFGRPIYGDVFGQDVEPQDKEDQKVDDIPRWGEMVEEEEEEEEEEEVPAEEEEEEEKEEEEEEEEHKEGLASVIPGMETPAEGLELRKKVGTETPMESKRLFTVLEEQENKNIGAAIFAPTHTYALPSKTAPQKESRPDFVKSQLAEKEIAVALAPEELEQLDENLIKEKYQQELEAEKAERMAQRSDANKLLAERDKKKRKAADSAKGKAAKKQKEFKF